MSTFLVDALALPPASRVSHRVPKKSLIENGAPTAADKKLIETGIEEVHWVAALKPSTIGILPFNDDVRDYGEIVVFTAKLRDQTRVPRLVELIHRAVPYPVVLCVEHRGASILALAHKRASQANGGAVVVEDVSCSTMIGESGRSSAEEAFVGSLAFSAQPSQHLCALYQGWLDRLIALEAAALTGTFALSRTTEENVARRTALSEHRRIARELASVRAQAEREPQLARRVDLNLKIKQLEAELAATDRLL